jgi:hypothetical protein
LFAFVLFVSAKGVFDVVCFEQFVPVAIKIYLKDVKSRLAPPYVSFIIVIAKICTRGIERSLDLVLVNGGCGSSEIRFKTCVGAPRLYLDENKIFTVFRNYI